MRSRIVTRYYCDFCKKAGLSSFHMRNHEKRCTLNPDRECRMHKHVGVAQAPMPTLIAASRVGLDELRAVAGGCPACILAALRLEKLVGIGPFFDFKAESKAFWQRINNELDEYN